MKKIKYKVVHIYEEDFGCEGRPDGYTPMVEVYLSPQGTEETSERKILQEDAWLYEQNIKEGDLVEFDTDRLRHWNGLD